MGRPFEEKEQKIMKYIPEKKKEAVKTAWIDSDGYWIVLHDGWNADRMDWNCHTIHEDNIKELRYQIAGIARRNDEKE